MDTTKLKDEIQNRLDGTKITVEEISRHCGKLMVRYKKGKSTNTLNFYNATIDSNDPVGCIAGEIMMEEA